MDFKEVVEILTRQNKTISTMESCTGGGVANAITNVEGASEVLKFSAVTYSNEYKVKMGVAKDVIDQYTVYSQETADEMSKNISRFANSDFGVGITGKLNKVDIQNPGAGEDNVVFISIYDRKCDTYYREKIVVGCGSRSKNKDEIIEKIIVMLLQVIKK